MGNLSFFDTEEPSARELSLNRLCLEISQAVSGIGKVVVEGEVVKPITRPSGWTYFTLADRAVSIQVALAPSRNSPMTARHGDRVRVVGVVDFISRRGQLNLRAEYVTPVGDGAIAQAIAAVRERLEADGILARPRKPIPVLPRMIGVVCGAKAAVREDIESVVSQRFPGYPLEIRTVPVSGPETPGAVTDAIGSLVRYGAGVIVVARGGGDPATLLPFSDELLCRTIADCPVPIVVAIGHEGDRPLCDEVADLRCGTPSLAAVAVVPDEVGLRGHLAGLSDRSQFAIYGRIRSEVQLLAKMAPSDLLRSRVEVAGERLEAYGISELMRSRLAESASKLSRFDLGTVIAHRLESSQLALSHGWAIVSVLDPRGVLERGYALVVREGDRLAHGSETGPGWRAIRSSSEISPGENLRMVFAHGSANAVVSSVEPGAIEGIGTIEGGDGVRKAQ